MKTLWIVSRHGTETRCIIDTRKHGRAGYPIKGSLRLLIDGVLARQRTFANIEELIALSGDWGQLAVASVGELQ